MNKNSIKDYSRKISERMWNLPDKGELESHREETYIDDIIQKNHIERTLLDNLEGIGTVFDAGAGCGRFSILLAKHGCRVTHFDLSQPMIDKAKELAKKAGVIDRITFVKGALEDLGEYTNKSFDMVVSFDAPISYTYPNQEQVIGELVRIAQKRIMISVTSRLGSLPYLANPIQKNQFILNGVKNIEMAGPGAYARTVPHELLVKIMNDSKQRSDFLDVCYQYDSNQYVCGMGKDNLLAKGDL